MSSCVDPVLGLGGAGPAPAARVVTGGDPAGAGEAADAGVAVVDEARLLPHFASSTLTLLIFLIITVILLGEAE